MKTGIELIAEEREKQISKYGYTPQHDSGYTNEELLQAALAYLKLAAGLGSTIDWPFDLKYLHDDGYVENLKKAGAFIAAALDVFQLNNE